MSHDDGIENGFFVKGKLILFEYGNSFSGTDRDVSFVRLDLT